MGLPSCRSVPVSQANLAVMLAVAPVAWAGGKACEAARGVYSRWQNDGYIPVVTECEGIGLLCISAYYLDTNHLAKMGAARLFTIPFGAASLVSREIRRLCQSS